MGLPAGRGDQQQVVRDFVIPASAVGFEVENGWAPDFWLITAYDPVATEIRISERQGIGPFRIRGTGQAAWTVPKESPNTVLVVDNDDPVARTLSIYASRGLPPPTIVPPTSLATGGDVVIGLTDNAGTLVSPDAAHLIQLVAGPGITTVGGLNLITIGSVWTRATGTVTPLTLTDKLGVGIVPTAQFHVDGDAEIDAGDSQIITILHDTFTQVDGSMWPATGVRLGKDLLISGGAGVGSANQSILNVFGTVPASVAALASYSKVGLYGRIHTSDPSTYAPDILADVTGVLAQGHINNGNALGRAFGGAFVASADGSGDGMLVGAEVDVNHAGSDQPTMDTTTTKYGLIIVNQQNASTLALRITKTGAGKWHKGILIDDGAIDVGANDSFMEFGTAGGGTLRLKSSNGYLGLGVVSPVAQLDVRESTGGALPAIRGQNAGNVSGLVIVNTQAEGIAAGASIAVQAQITPSAVDKRLGAIAFRGITTGTTEKAGGRIDVISGEAWDATHAGAYMSFHVTPTAAVSPVESFRILMDGSLKLTNAVHWQANGTGTVTISNKAPAGVGTATISRWLKVTGDDGIVYYIPAWT